MSVYFEIYQTVIQSTPMADFSFGFIEGSFLQLNGQKYLMSVAQDLISNNHKMIYRLFRRQGNQNNTVYD